MYFKHILIMKITLKMICLVNKMAKNYANCIPKFSQNVYPRISEAQAVVKVEEFGSLNPKNRYVI